ncbi:MAG: S9 family peptidase, partial [Chthoniobacterales bacterium]
MIRILLLALVSATSLAVAEEPARNDAPPLIPMRDFFRNPVAAAYQVIQCGDYISWMAPWEQRLNHFVQPLAGSAEPRRLTSATKR